MKSNFVQMNHFSIRPEFCLLNWTVLRGMSKSAHQSLKKGSLKKSSLMTVLETAMLLFSRSSAYWPPRLCLWELSCGLTGPVPHLYTVNRQGSSLAIFSPARLGRYRTLSKLDFDSKDNPQSVTFPAAQINSSIHKNCRERIPHIATSDSIEF